jgi:hypothetical protein
MQHNSKRKPQVSKPWIMDFCRRWRITEFAFFGSVLRRDFGPGSDVDVLVSFSPEADWGLWDHIRMEEELSKQFGRKVDLMTRRSIEHSHNWLLKQEILGTAEVIYGSG